MNLPLLASTIVARVHRSPDSVINLEQVVSNLIREEMKRENNEAQIQLDAWHYQFGTSRLSDAVEERDSLK